MDNSKRLATIYVDNVADRLKNLLWLFAEAFEEYELTKDIRLLRERMNYANTEGEEIIKSLRNAK